MSTARADPARLAWIGVERGPLPPKEAEQLEKLMIDELDGYDSFRLVDASGHALDARLLASEAALCARLKNEGVNLALEFKTSRALKKFDQAIAVFETRLIQLLDYELLHDTLLAKAEAQFQTGNRGAAKTTLKQLAALSPKRTPNAKTHPAGLVKLWEDAQDELGDAGTINIACDGCTVQLDGQMLGAAPLTASLIPPGKHHLVARWTHGFSYETVQVAPGRELKVVVERKGPAEESRVAMLAAIERRSGVREAAKIGARAAKLSQSAGTLIAAVKADGEGKRSLLLAHHDAKGALVAIVKAPLDQAVEDERTAKMVKRVGALMFVEKRQGEHVLAADGTSATGEGLAAWMYEGAAGAAPPPVVVGREEIGKAEIGKAEAGRESEGDADPELDVKVDPAPPPPGSGEIADAPPLGVAATAEEDESLVSQWWFWTLIASAAVVAGTGVGLGVWAGSRDPSTTQFEVILP
jgi:tetratricopeptide (TPR) repeat protein